MGTTKQIPRRRTGGAEIRPGAEANRAVLTPLAGAAGEKAAAPEARAKSAVPTNFIVV